MHGLKHLTPAQLEAALNDNPDEQHRIDVEVDPGGLVVILEGQLKEPDEDSAASQSDLARRLAAQGNGCMRA